MEKKEELAKSKPNASWDIWKPFWISLAFALGMLVRVSLDQSDEIPLFKLSKHSTPTSSKFSAIKSFVGEEYYQKINTDSMEELAIEDMVDHLDPYSAYFSAKQQNDHLLALQGNHKGIGIEYQVIDDSVYVTRIIPNGPASNSKLKLGDIILEANDSIISGIEKEGLAIHKTLVGEENSILRLKVKSLDGRLAQLDIKRGSYEIPSIDPPIKLAKNILYLKINHFSSKVYGDFMKYLENNLDHTQPTNLIIDVRDNPGGILQEVTKMLSQLITDKGVLLVYTDGENQQKNEYTSTGKAFFNLGKIAVLINQNSASASEVLAGSLQDHDRAVIVGNNSFGKGLVQTDREFEDGSAVKLTISKYYLPSGRCIQRPLNEKEKSENAKSKKEFFTAKGRKMTEGEGIQPDIRLVDAKNDSLQNLIFEINKIAFKLARKNKFQYLIQINWSPILSQNPVILRHFNTKTTETLAETAFIKYCQNSKPSNEILVNEPYIKAATQSFK